MPKIDGELARAQAECLSGDPGGSQPVGRFYMDVTTPSASLYKYYNGTAWKTLATTDQIPSANQGQIFTAVGVQSANYTFTMDSTVGTVAQYILVSGNITLSLSNASPPTTNKRYLINVQNNSSALPLLYNWGSTDLHFMDGIYQPQILFEAQLTRYTFEYFPAFKAAQTFYANYYTQLTLPTLGTAGATTVHASGAFSPKGTHFAMGVTATTIDIFQVNNRLDITGATLSSPVTMSPFGFQKEATPVAAAGTISGVAYHPYENIIYFAGATTPFAEGAFCSGSGIPLATKLAAATTLPSAARTVCDVSPYGGYVAFGGGTTPFIEIYSKYLGNTKASNPASLPSGTCHCVKFAPTGDYIAAIGATSPYLEVWAWTESTGSWGTKSSSPGVLPSGSGGTTGSLAWHPSGNWIAVATGTTNVAVYPFNRSTGTFGTQFTGTTPANSTAVAWSPCGSYLVAGQASSTNVTVFDFSNLTSLSTVASYTVGGSAQVNAIAVHPSGYWCVCVLNASPYFSVCRMPTRAKNWIVQRISNGNSSPSAFS